MTSSERPDERAAREWAKDVVRSVAAVPIRNTDAVPTFKRRVTACIDRAAVLIALEHAATPPPPALDVTDLLRDALEVQRTGCDHEGIGKPGCRTCDPRVYEYARPTEVRT